VLINLYKGFSLNSTTFMLELIAIFNPSAKLKILSLLSKFLHNLSFPSKGRIHFSLFVNQK